MWEFLESGKFLKLICAAGNEDFEQVEKLVYIYSKAGCRFFDVAASKNIITVAQNAIKKADCNEKVFVCVSVGTKNDQHIQKAYIKQSCNQCGLCVDVCPQKAILDFKVEVNKCIGCLKCCEVCRSDAIELKPQKQDFEAFLPGLMSMGVDCIEFHISDFDDEVFEKWKWLSNNFDGVLSVSIGASKFNDSQIVEILDTLLAVRKPYSTIIQADGTPMSGYANTVVTTQKCIETGLLIQEQNYKAYLNLAGGTNLKTVQLSCEKKLDFDGIALGTFARKAVEKYIFAENFWTDIKMQKEAISVAKQILIRTFSC